MTILDQIVDNKREEIKKVNEFRSLYESIIYAQKSGNAIISEIKPKSPSEGQFREMNVGETAKKMEDARACAISVLTDSDYFGGSLGNIIKAKRATSLPILMKEFIVDEIQLRQAKAIGADCVLLMVCVLGENTVKFVELAKKVGLETLVEIHSKDEIDIAIKSKSRLIGINNRDLKTMKIDLNTTKNLSKMLPHDRVVVSESGINSIDDIRDLRGRANAFLIGSSIMKSDDISKKVGEFVNG